MFFAISLTEGITPGIAQIAQFQFICFAFVGVSCYMILYGFITIILYNIVINIVLERRRQGKLVQRHGMGERGERACVCRCLPFYACRVENK